MLKFLYEYNLGDIGTDDIESIRTRTRSTFQRKQVLDEAITR